MKKKPPRTRDALVSSFVYAIDGPSGSGKTTTARGLAARLGLRHVDTGAMYRAVTLAALDTRADLADGPSLGALADSLDIDLRAVPGGNPGAVVLLGERDVSTDIRSERVTAAVSQVSAHASVRRAMVRRQRELARAGGVVLEGRDIGSVVLPGADVKIYLDASTRVRAERRRRDLSALGVERTVDEVESDLVRRDAYDSGREVSPLVEPVGAWTVDTSERTIEGQIDAIVEIAAKTAEARLRLLAPLSDGTRPRAQRPVWRISQTAVRVLLWLVFGLHTHRRLRGTLEENYIFACNHTSNVDPPFVGSTFPREVHFIAKASLFRPALFRWLIQTYNAIPIRRGIFDREAMGLSVELLASGRSMVIFPEGGRVFTGELGPAKSGVGYLATQTGVAVVPVYARGMCHLRRCLLRRERMVVGHGTPIRIPAELLAQHQNPESYRRFADMVMAGIAAVRDDVDRSVS